MPPLSFAPAEAAKSRFRVLIADDNEMFAAAIRGMLESLGHSVEVVTNGRDAIEAAARQDFDYVFLDFQMPEVGGFETASSLRQRRLAGSSTQIIGFSAQRDRSQAQAAGMDGFLLKPVRIADLVGVLDRFVGPQETSGLAQSAPLRERPDLRLLSCNLQ